MSRCAIQVEGLGKEYIIGGAEQRHDSFREMLSGALTAPLRKLRKLGGVASEEERFWALQDVSFQVEQGEVLGIIGQNGAGKSTLLKVLSRITAPTTGTVSVKGRLASLLEVGTGFHPELTGRENVYLNGAILGMGRAEISRRFDEIVDFADVGRFVDTPVKRYSSGMYVRLAFAVAAHLDADVLLVDEVLAVGDVAFQSRCLGKMQDVAGAGRTVLFVSHNLGAVSQLCGRSILLDGGQVAIDAPTAGTIQEYLSLTADRNLWDSFDPSSGKKTQLTRLSVQNIRGEETHSCLHSEPLTLAIEYEVSEWPAGAYLCVDIFSQSGARLIWSADVVAAKDLMAERPPGTYRAKATVPPSVLAPGRYYFTVAVYSPASGEVFDIADKAVTVEVHDGGSLLAGFGMQSGAMTSIPLAWETRRS